MQHIYLVACAGTKQDTPAPAKDLYISSLFSKSREYAQNNADSWFILSAKHGLLHPDTVTAPYNLTVNTMPRAERRIWAKQVLHNLKPLLEEGDNVTLLAGKRYREDLVTPLEAQGCVIHLPLDGLSIGKQLQWLNQANT